MLLSARLFAAVALSTFVGCATGHEAMRGSVVMKVSDTEAHVCIFQQKAEVGSRVQLYRHVCVTKYGKRYHCDKTRVAIGTVTERLGEHYAVVTFPQGTSYDEGYTVESIRE